MATFYCNSGSANQGEIKREAGNTVAQPICFAKRTYTFVGTEVENDTIDIMGLPKGAMVHTRLSFVNTSGALGAAVALDIGDTDGAGNATRYASDMDVNALGSVPFDLHPDYVLTGSCRLTAMLDTFTTPDAVGESLVFYVYYSLPAH